MKANRLRFRIWLKHVKEMLIDDYGEMPFLRADGRVILEYDGLDVTDDIVFMQSTGLCDKKGKEIFEGDILIEDCPRGNKCVVKWDDLHASFHIAYDEKHHTVIGNIHENPELLKGNEI